MPGTHEAAPPARPPAARAAPTDAQVMAGVKAGSSDAFAVLYERYRDRAHRVTRHVCWDDGRAREAVQEAFIGIWMTRATYEDRGNVSAWVLTVARNRAIDINRRNRPHAAHRARADALAFVPAAEQDVDADAIAADQAIDLWARVAQLPEAQRVVITLRFCGELSNPEIAAHLAVPLGTVKGRMRLGLRRLRGELSAPAGVAATVRRKP